MDMRANIRAWLDRGDAADAAWYRNTKQLCMRLARRSRVDYRRVVGVMAAMSPGTSFERNVTETEALLTGADIEYTTYGANVEKARGILAAPKRRCYLALVKPQRNSGFKIGAFYQNIVDPADPEPVTIDRHAIAIARGSRDNLRVTAKQYEEIAQAYRDVAAERGMLANEVQAITWCVFRRMNGDLHQQPLPFGGI